MKEARKLKPQDEKIKFIEQYEIETLNHVLPQTKLFSNDDIFKHDVTINRVDIVTKLTQLSSVKNLSWNWTYFEFLMENKINNTYIKRCIIFHLIS